MPKWLLAWALVWGARGVAAQSDWARVAPGSANATVERGRVTLSNAAIEVVWRTDGGLRLREAKSTWAQSRLSGAYDAFVLIPREGRPIRSSELRIVAGPEVLAAAVDEASPRRSDRVPGRVVWLRMQDRDAGIEVEWRAMLRDGSHYVRQSVAIKARREIDLAELVLFDWRLSGASVVGEVPGSPGLADGWFFGVEHPMATTTAGERVRCSLTRRLPIPSGSTVEVSSVVGAYPDGQARRSFGTYVDRERARAYAPFLHYNSWYDLAFGAPFDAAGCLDRIDAFGRELVGRGAKLDSFVFDDGWDDTKTDWRFHAGFPDGFAPLREAAAKYGAGIGVWLSPWGGYGRAREERLTAGRNAGYEVGSQGFALSGPRYFARFQEACIDFVRRFGVNHFKFDGTGSPDHYYPGSAFGSDFDAAIELIRELRGEYRDLFVNLTTGTWPSPFWTRYADSIWRGGSDHAFAGVGSSRRRWITYRDGQTYTGVVRRAPLFPLNSLMTHGIIFAEHAGGLKADPDAFAEEVRSYFGSGTQLQELYVTPGLLSPQMWDALAQAARWARANANVLVDAHWVGGDPHRLEVYGWAAWSPRKAILTLRNPSHVPQAYSVDIGALLEAPQTRGTYTMKNAFGPGEWVFAIGKSRVVQLDAFEVLVLEGSAR